VGGGVIASLEVAEGERVELDQILATLDDHALRTADVARLEAELSNASRDADRARRLSKRSVTSAANLDAAEVGLRIAHANLAAARARLELTRVRAPIAGQILEIHAHPGERVGPEGVLEMGDTQNMKAVAEVYETDIASVSEGQRAVIRSAALAAPISGVVGRIGLKVGRMDVLGTDPIAKADARVVEVRIDLDSSEEVARLTNLQVEIEIEP
jgi:HlyD family secretion protein